MDIHIYNLLLASLSVLVFITGMVTAAKLFKDEIVRLIHIFFIWLVSVLFFVFLYSKPLTV
jgi:hypothetical protein